jgi:hypothetical protein
MPGVFERLEYGDGRDAGDLMLRGTAAEEKEYPGHAGQVTVVLILD